MCGCGATSIGLPLLNVNGPKRSRKHHGPIIRRSLIGSALEIVSDPRLNSRFWYDSSRGRLAPSATHSSADTSSERFDMASVPSYKILTVNCLSQFPQEVHQHL